MVEFAIVVPLLILLLCGAIDFGLIFGGYQSMESGVASATRALAVDQYQYSGNLCSSTTATGQAVCNVVADLGPLSGLNSSTLAVGICFVAPGSALSCGAGSLTTGTAGVDDVVVCAQAAMQSTTGLTSVFVSGSNASTSSRQLLEEPQPSGASNFGSYNAGSTAVKYNGISIAGLTCT